MLGTGHSFNDMADSPGAQVSLAGLPPEVEVDSAAALVRVAAGLTYGDLASRLDRQRFALRNLASLPHISVAGACATGTHGSGPANQNLSAAVTGLELVTADGNVVELNRGDDAFAGAVVHLGALGAVTRLILELVPSFEVSQRVYEDLPLDVLDDHFAEIMASGYSVSMFTDWRAPRLTQLWIKSLAEDGTPPVTEEPWFTATPAPTARNPVPGLPAANSTAQLGEPGPWFERLPHFRPEFTPSAGDELQTEYLLPAEHAVDAVHALQRAGDRIAPVLRIGEIRTIAGGRAVAEPRLPPGQRGLPLHLAPRHRRGAARGHADRAAAGPVRARARTGARSSPPRRPTSTQATTACPISSTSPGTTTPRASSATPTPPAAWAASQVVLEQHPPARSAINTHLLGESTLSLKLQG